MKKHVIGFLIPILSSSIIAPTLFSCGPKDDKKHEITVTFDARDGGYIVDTDERTIDLNFKEGTKWSEVESMAPRAWIHDAYEFKYWSLDGNTTIDPNYVLQNNDTLIAHYQVRQHEHEFDWYQVDEDHKVWGHCNICEQTVRLSDNQLQDLADTGRFLVKNTNGTITLNEEGKTISDYIRTTSGSTLDVYPIGVHYLSGNRNGFTLNVHGLRNSINQQISYIDSYNEDAVSDEKIHYLYGITLHCDDAVLYGKDTKGIWSGGILANQLICDNCTLLGEMGTYSGKTEFNHCAFDSTDIKIETDYSVYCYGGTVKFDHCTFKSDGKAIKVYSNGTATNCTEVYDCTFTIVEHEDDTAAVNINAYYHWDAYQRLGIETTCVVYIDGCSIDKTYTDHSLGLYAVKALYEDWTSVTEGRKPA